MVILSIWRLTFCTAQAPQERPAWKCTSGEKATRREPEAGVSQSSFDKNLEEKQIGRYATFRQSPSRPQEEF